MCPPPRPSVCPIRRTATRCTSSSCPPRRAAGLEARLWTRLKESLRAVAVPSEVHVLADLPINAAGKVDKSRLRERIAGECHRPKSTRSIDRSSPNAPRASPSACDFRRSMSAAPSSRGADSMSMNAYSPLCPCPPFPSSATPLLKTRKCRRAAHARHLQQNACREKCPRRCSVCRAGKTHPHAHSKHGGWVSGARVQETPVKRVERAVRGGDEHVAVAFHRKRVVQGPQHRTGIDEVGGLVKAMMPDGLNHARRVQGGADAAPADIQE